MYAPLSNVRRSTFENVVILWSVVVDHGTSDRYSEYRSDPGTHPKPKHVVRLLPIGGVTFCWFDRTEYVYSSLIASSTLFVRGKVDCYLYTYTRRALFVRRDTVYPYIYIYLNIF